MSQSMLPYGRHWIDDADIEAVVSVLRSDWLTTGPLVSALEQAFAATCRAAEAVAVSNGTAALHAAMHALDIKAGDEVIVPTLTFAASANCVVYQGGTPVFVDVDADTLLIDPDLVRRRIGPRTKAIVAVDYAGQPCDYDALLGISGESGIPVVADACHALGARYRDRPVGSIAKLSTFSLHPVKHITAGEGGIITTDDPQLAARMRIFRNHGIATDHRQREQAGAWFYEMVELGFNYRLTDIQCALAISQLHKLPGWVARRQEIAQRYDRAFADTAGIRPLGKTQGATHSYHLYVVRIPESAVAGGRQRVFSDLRARGIGVNVHYVPVHLHPFYRSRFGTGPGMCPVAEQRFTEILSLPMFPGMSDADVDMVIQTMYEVCS